MYIMFPIGIMYYFGTNLDSRFSVPDFWPKEGQTHTIPFEKDDIKMELERLKQRRLAARARRLAIEGDGFEAERTTDQIQTRGERAEEMVSKEDGKSSVGGQKSWWGLFGR